MISPLTRRRSFRFSGCLLAIVVATMAMAGPLAMQGRAAPPELRDIAPRGLRSGATTHIVVQGDHLSERTRLLLPTTPTAEVRVTSAAANQLEMDVTLPADVPADLYPLRLVNDAGISAALLVPVDDLPLESFRDNVAELPIALHGAFTGDQVLRTQFTGRAGQALVVDVEGRRLGSPLRPVLRLFGPDGRMLAMARPQIQLLGDARLAVTLPTDGTYRVEMHDVVYQGPGPGTFRLKIGELHFADRVFPSTIARPSMGTLEYLGGNIAEHATAPLSIDLPRDRAQAVPWPTATNAHYTGPRPRVVQSEFGDAEWTEEQARAGGVSRVAPLGISGRIGAASEQDTFTIEVQPESRLRIDLLAARIGSPLDAVLEAFAGTAEANGQPTGASLGRADDQPNSADPLLDVQVPADVRQLTLRVSSLTREGGPTHDYRLVVQPIESLSPLLTSDAHRVIVPAGGHLVLPVRVQHRATPRPLHLHLDAPPELLRIGSDPLDAAEDLTLVDFHAPDATLAAFTVRLLARAADAGSASTAALTVPAPTRSIANDSLRHDLAVAITPAAPIGLRFASSLPTHWDRGTRQPIGVQLARVPGGHAGPVRLSLISSQVPPTKQENNQTVPDLARTLRIMENPVVPAGASDATIQLFTPTDLAVRPWSLAVQAELLSDDGQTVLATVHSPVLRRPARDPLTLEANVPAKLTVQAGQDDAVTLEGSVRRVAMPDTAVIVQLVGLPAGLPELQTVVPAGETSWKLPIKLPRETAAQEIKDVRLVVRYQEADERLAEVRVSSTPFVLEVTAAAP